MGDVNLIDRAKVRELLSRAPHLKVMFVAGGSPCQGVSRINATGAGWGDERARLARQPGAPAWCLNLALQLVWCFSALL